MEKISKKEMKEIRRGLEDIKAGRVFTEKQAAKRLGIKARQQS